MKRNIDIFIRTYHKDLPFLQYCLKSIHKFVTGYNKIIICIPEQEAHLLDSWNLTQEVIVKWKPTTANGYIDQQISKLMAHTMCLSDYILYVDSDIIFTEYTDLSEFFIDDKPYLMKTRYELVGDAICWKDVTEKIMRKELTHEYMRRLPALYRTDTIAALDDFIDCMTLSRLNKLSEFNLIGAFIEEYQPENYTIIDTELHPLPKKVAHQYWSWGTLTPELEKEIQNILNK